MLQGAARRSFLPLPSSPSSGSTRLHADARCCVDVFIRITFLFRNKLGVRKLIFIYTFAVKNGEKEKNKVACDVYRFHLIRRRQVCAEQATCTRRRLVIVRDLQHQQMQHRRTRRKSVAESPGMSAPRARHSRYFASSTSFTNAGSPRSSLIKPSATNAETRFVYLPSF